MNKYKILLIIGIIFFSLYMMSCNDAPTEMGEIFIPDTVSVNIITGQDSILIPRDSSYVMYQPNEFNTGVFLVGAANQLRAGAILRCDLPSDLDWVTEDDIKSFELVLFPQKYALGDTLGSNLLSFEIKELVDSIDINTVIPPDVLDVETLYGGKAPIATWSGNIKYPENDTAAKDSLVVALPKSVCFDWLQKKSKNMVVHGVALLPKNESTVINQFTDGNANADMYGARSYYRMVYRKQDGTDSVYAKPLDFSQKFVENYDAINKNSLMMQGAIKIHSYLDFDISQISDIASINLAELTLTLDEEKSYYGSTGEDSIALLRLYRSLDDEKNKISPIVTVPGYRESGTNIYTFDTKELAIALMYFLKNQGGKGSLVLAGNPNLSSVSFRSTEYNQVNRVVFCSATSADLTKRPTLKVVYTEIKSKNN